MPDCCVVSFPATRVDVIQLLLATVMVDEEELGNGTGAVPACAVELPWLLEGSEVGSVELSEYLLEVSIRSILLEVTG